MTKPAPLRLVVLSIRQLPQANEHLSDAKSGNTAPQPPRNAAAPLAVYTVAEEAAGERRVYDVVAPALPTIRPGSEVAFTGKIRLPLQDSVSEDPPPAAAERIVPFDWSTMQPRV
jgi:hypothetical protein